MELIDPGIVDRTEMQLCNTTLKLPGWSNLAVDVPKMAEQNAGHFFKVLNI